jgi:peptidoglycan/xylan/chitin deacetylase (PgdA/CDA1 family)
MLRRRKILAQDIRATQEILQQAGIQPHVFRPPAGITNPHLAEVLANENLIPVNYSCRAWDRGNKNITNLAGKILARLQPGDIIMLHDLPPYLENLSDYWQQELEHLFTALENNYYVVPLTEIIQCPVMSDNRLFQQ